MAAACLVAACAPPERPARTVVIASGADLESANPLVTVHPLSRQVQRHVLFVTLVRADSALRPAPYLARSWRWSPDRRALTFDLADGVRWHDGRPMTSADAAFTIDAARDRATGYPRYADLADLVAVEAPDARTLVLRFATPPADFPQVLVELPVLPRHLLAAVPRAEMRRAAFNLAPVGGGPFRFAGRTAGQRWVFERSPDFALALGGPPRVERLVVAVVDEPATKFAGLVSGELDAAGIPPTVAPLVAEDRALRVLSYPVLFSNAIIFNASRPPFDDVRVRRAVSLSLDRERIIEAALAGYGVPAAGPVPADHPLAAPARGPLRDTRLADSLLDAAGWRRGPDGGRRRGGRPLAFDLQTVGSGDNAVEQLVQADLAARGVRVEIRLMEMGAFLAAARATPRRFGALLTGIPGDLSLAYLASMFDSGLAGGALDYAGFHTPRLDALLGAARRAPDAARARAAWAAVQEELAREVPAAWIYHSRGLQGLSRRLRNVTMDLRGELATVHDWDVGGQGAGPR
ncbi:MAG: ABC transporter substrate-binding protein [Gemmatimonadaceae bacterium]